MDDKIPCAGVIALRYDDKLKRYETIIVKTHHGRYGFPKGKREKNETTIQNALREFHEETGLQININDLVLKNGNYVYVDEFSRKGNPSIRYYVTIMRKSSDINDILSPIDINELVEAKWTPVEKFLSLDDARQSRKDILLKVINCAT